MHTPSERAANPLLPTVVAAPTSPPAVNRHVAEAAIALAAEHPHPVGEARRRGDAARERDNLAVFARWRAAERLLRALGEPAGLLQ